MFVTLHSCGAKFLSCEEDGVVVILGIPCILLLLQEGPATHILQTLRWVPHFNQTRGLERDTHREKKKIIEIKNIQEQQTIKVSVLIQHFIQSSRGQRHNVL